MIIFNKNLIIFNKLNNIMSYIGIDKKDSYYIYDRNGIDSLTKTKNWNNCLYQPLKSKTNKYKLYATGECDLTGRKYVALPIEININDPNIKNKYNLL